MLQPRLVCYNCKILQAENLCLREHIAALENKLSERDELIIEQQNCILAQVEENQTLKSSVYNLQKQAFGSKSEKKNKLKSSPSPASNANKSNNKQRKKPNRINSRRIPPEIPREKIELSLAVNESICPCCGEQLQVIGSKTSEQLDIVQAMLRAIQYVRKQYACPKCKNKRSMKLAPLPKEHCSNVLATPELLAWVINNKYDYHLPLYRISRMLAAQGFKISDKTLNSWVLNEAFYLEPLLARAIDQLILSKHIFSDDTTGRLVIPGESKTKTSRLWLYMSKAEPKIVVYDFTLTREGKHPQRFLKNFTGYLQTDAYKGYYGLYTDDAKNIVVIPVFCMAHCRRRFFTIAEKTTTHGLANIALEYINNLYVIESQIKALTAEEKFKVRQEKAIPILSEFYVWLADVQKTVMPKTELYEAISYPLNHQEALTNYCLDGNLEIDNNRSEQKMKGPVLGRKNYMFFGSERGGKAAAIYYSFIESCKENNISPAVWLADVIPKLHYYKINEIDELLPHNWAKKLSQNSTIAA